MADVTTTSTDWNVLLPNGTMASEAWVDEATARTTWISMQDALKTFGVTTQAVTLVTRTTTHITHDYTVSQVAEVG